MRTQSRPLETRPRASSDSTQPSVDPIRRSRRHSRSRSTAAKPHAPTSVGQQCSGTADIEGRPGRVGRRGPYLREQPHLVVVAVAADLRFRKGLALVPTDGRVDLLEVVGDQRLPPNHRLADLTPITPNHPDFQDSCRPCLVLLSLISACGVCARDVWRKLQTRGARSMPKPSAANSTPSNNIAKSLKVGISLGAPAVQADVVKVRSPPSMVPPVPLLAVTWK